MAVWLGVALQATFPAKHGVGNGHVSVGVGVCVGVNVGVRDGVGVRVRVGVGVRVGVPTVTVGVGDGIGVGHDDSSTPHVPPGQFEIHVPAPPPEHVCPKHWLLKHCPEPQSVSMLQKSP